MLLLSFGYVNINSTPLTPADAAAAKRSRKATSLNIVVRFALNFGTPYHSPSIPPLTILATCTSPLCHSFRMYIPSTEKVTGPM
jgi:hypothetical protein